MIGGSDDFGPVSFVQYFDQDAKVWTLWEELPVPIGISASSAVNVNDDIYLIGGNGNESNILQLDLGTQQWFNTTNLEHVSDFLNSDPFRFFHILIHFFIKMKFDPL